MTTRRGYQSILLLTLALLTACNSQSLATPEVIPKVSGVAIDSVIAPVETSTVAVTLSSAPASAVSAVAPTAAAEAVTAVPIKTIEPGTGEIDAFAQLDQVFKVRQDGQDRLQVPSQQRVLLGLGDGVDVDPQGWAILRYGDLWTAEVLRGASLQFNKLVGDRQNLAAEVRLRSGALFNNFDPAQVANLDMRVLGDLAMVVALNASVAVVEEDLTSLQWTVVLNAPPPLEMTGAPAETPSTLPTPLTGKAGTTPAQYNLVQVNANGVTTVASVGNAIWTAPVGPPSQPIAIDVALVEQWFSNLANGIPQPEIGEILLPPADLEANICAQPPLLEPNKPFDMEGVAVTLASESAFGPASYWVEDCNKDGLQDIAMRNGSLRLDFRGLPVRVRALDVPLINRMNGDAGFLAVLDPAVQEMDRQAPAALVGQEQLLSLRSAPGRPYHYADLTLKEGCFLGVSLTPPLADGAPGAPRRPATETFPVPGAQCQLAVGIGKSPRTFLRTGPGSDCPSTTALVQRGDVLAPLAQNPKGDWLLLKAPNGQQGWAPLTFLSCVDIRCLPIVKSPPPPRATETVAPIPVPVKPRPTSPAATPVPIVPTPASTVAPPV